MNTGKILRKLRLSPLSRHYNDEKSNHELKDFDCESTGEFTDFTVSSSASFSDYSSSFDDRSEWEGDNCSRRVRFYTKEDRREVPSLSSMTSSEREGRFYLRDELLRMKTEARALAQGISSKKKDMVMSLTQCYNQAKFLSESGFDEDELSQIGNGSIMENLKPWSSAIVAGDACRGLEKSLLRRERESTVNECRQAVIETTLVYQEDAARADMVAAAYSQLSRHASIYAQSVAKADETAAREC